MHLYYDMKLVTFRIDKKRNLIIQFPIFVQPYTQQPLILYQLKMVPVPIVDTKHSGRFICSTPDKETILSIKFRDVYKHQTAGIGHM